MRYEDGENNDRKNSPSLRDKQLQSIEKLVYFFRRKHRGGGGGGGENRRRTRRREGRVGGYIVPPSISDPPAAPYISRTPVHSRANTPPARRIRTARAFITDPVHVRYWPLIRVRAYVHIIYVHTTCIIYKCIYTRVYTYTYILRRVTRSPRV